MSHHKKIWTTTKLWTYTKIINLHKAMNHQNNYEPSQKLWAITRNMSDHKNMNPTKVINRHKNNEQLQQLWTPTKVMSLTKIKNLHNYKPSQKFWTTTKTAIISVICSDFRALLFIPHTCVRKRFVLTNTHLIHIIRFCISRYMLYVIQALECLQHSILTYAQSPLSCLVSPEKNGKFFS